VKKTKSAFVDALKKTYALRSTLFFKRVQRQILRDWLEAVGKIDGSSIEWNFDVLGIRKAAADKVGNAGVPLHYVFCHPDVLRSHPELEDYYRNLTALSKKGFSQIFAGQKLVGDARSHGIARVFNEILSEAFEAWPGFSMDLVRDVIWAELGTEIQGSWVNFIGTDAAKRVEAVIREFAAKKNLLKKVPAKRGKMRVKKSPRRSILLKNDWQIIFSSEPDIAVYDPEGLIRVAVEVKGSMDVRGTQTRYGEAKKSFGKALRENPRCETIYLASIYTDSVTDQIHANGQVRKTFDLIDILADERAKEAFLDEIFKYQIRLDY
jgi:hypothetical protein